MSSAQATRMNSIIDLWDYELERNNAGAFGMQYIVSHPTTRLHSAHILKATALIQQIMGYIAGGDGLSQAEIDLLCENQQLLCCYTFTAKLARENLEIGASFDEKQLSEAIAGYLEGCDVSMDGDKKQHLVSALYMTLCVAGSDGLGEANVSKFHVVTEQMGFSQQESDKIVKTYKLECDLISSFNDIYGH